MADRDLLYALLTNLETEMRAVGLWQQSPPDNAAFESQLPFCYDTMNFGQWLQWVFMTRFRAILEANLPLPGECGIAPMAEEYFSQLEVYSDPVVELLRRFDDQFQQG